MAAQTTTISLTRDTWTSITANSLAALTAQNSGKNDVYILATVANTAPTGGPKGIRLKPGIGIDSTKTLAELFPGLATPAYVFAYCEASAGTIFVSHAAS